MSILKYKLYEISGPRFLLDCFLMIALALTAYAVLPAGVLDAYKGYLKLILLPAALYYTYVGVSERWPAMASVVLTCGVAFWFGLLISTVR